MNTSSPPNRFDIISTIRSDANLLHSRENILVNAKVNQPLAREPNQFYMLSHHLDRMLAAAEEFDWDTSPLEGPQAFTRFSLMLHDHLQSEHSDRNYPAPLMLRIALSANGRFTVTSNGPHPGPATIDDSPHSPHAVSQLYPLDLDSIYPPNMTASLLGWRVFIAFERVTPTSFTIHKTSNRQVYDEALVVIPAQPPVLVLNGVPLQSEILIVNDRGEIMEGCRFTPYFRRGHNWITPAATCGGNHGTTRRWALEKGICETGIVQADSVMDDEIIVLSNGAKGFQCGILKRWESVLTNGTKD